MKKHYEEQIRELMDKQTKLEKEVLVAEKDKERMKKDLGKLDQVTHISTRDLLFCLSLQVVHLY